MKVAQKKVNLVQSRPKAWSVPGLDLGNVNLVLVCDIIHRGGYDHEGVDRACIHAKLENHMSRANMDVSLEWLAAEGHIFTTVDEDHFVHSAAWDL